MSEFLGKTLVQAFRQAKRFACTATDRGTINSVMVTFEGTELVFVATDGQRLARLVAGTTDDTTTDAKCIVASADVNQIMKQLKSAASYQLTVTDTCITFTNGTNELQYAGKSDIYVAYKRVVPAHFKHIAVCDTVQIINAIKRVACVCPGEPRQISFSCAGNKLKLSALNAQGDSSVDYVSATGASTPMPAIHADADYILDALECVTESEFELSVNDDLAPFRIASSGFYSIIMPVRAS